MDLMESFRTLRRRWILTSVLILLTLAGTAAAFVKLPSTYQAESMTVFLSSKNAARPAGDNPYLSFADSLTLTADIVRREVMDPRMALDLKNRGYRSTYLVVAAPDTAGPVLLITTTGSHSSQVEHTLQGVTDQVATQLLQLQTSISPSNRIRDMVISMTPTATSKPSKKARPLAALLAIGLACTFGIPQVVDAWATRRKSVHEMPGPAPAGPRARPARAGPRARPEPAGSRADLLADDRAGSHDGVDAVRPRIEARTRADRSMDRGPVFDPDDHPAPATRSRFR